MGEVFYTIADPTKNITALITSEVPFDVRGAIAKEVFDACPKCEQVGFVNIPDDADFELRMAGGEFCGNATISAASLCAYNEGIKVGEKRVVMTKSSGVPNVLAVDVECVEDKKFWCSVQMPAPERIIEIDGYPVVCLPGISHMIVPAGAMTDDEALARIRDYCERGGADAFGILFWNEETSTMRPLVFAKGECGDTLVWESGCATGSTSVGIWRALREAKARGAQATEDELTVTTNVHQPGGTITIKTKIRSHNHEQNGWIFDPCFATIDATQYQNITCYLSGEVIIVATEERLSTLII